MRSAHAQWALGVIGVSGQPAQAAYTQVSFCKLSARIATDCSGIGIPELAMKAISQAFGMAYQVVVSCDNRMASQTFLQRNVNPMYMLADIGERVFRTSSFATTAVVGQAPLTNNCDCSVKC